MISLSIDLSFAFLTLPTTMLFHRPGFKTGKRSKEEWEEQIQEEEKCPHVLYLAKVAGKDGGLRGGRV
jgi:hypothetical protein